MHSLFVVVNKREALFPVGIKNRNVVIHDLGWGHASSPLVISLWFCRQPAEERRGVLLGRLAVVILEVQHPSTAADKLQRKLALLWKVVSISTVVGAW